MKLVSVSRADVNASGQVIGFRLHDSTLIGLHYDSDDLLVLRLRRDDGTKVDVRLGGVGEVGTNGFRAPAVVSDVYAWAPSETPLTARSLADGAWNVLFAGELRAETLAKEVERIASENEFAYLVLVSCSYGGALAALCKRIDVAEVQPT